MDAWFFGQVICRSSQIFSNKCLPHQKNQPNIKAEWNKEITRFLNHLVIMHDVYLFWDFFWLFYINIFYFVFIFRLLVSASQDGKLIIWDSYTTNKVELLYNPFSCIICVFEQACVFCLATTEKINERKQSFSNSDIIFSFFFHD